VRLSECLVFFGNRGGVQDLSGRLPLVIVKIIKKGTLKKRRRNPREKSSCLIREVGMSKQGLPVSIYPVIIYLMKLTSLCLLCYSIMTKASGSHRGMLLFPSFICIILLHHWLPPSSAYISVLEIFIILLYFRPRDTLYLSF
jgi:hypothetical protein